MMLAKTTGLKFLEEKQEVLSIDDIPEELFQHGTLLTISVFRNIEVEGEYCYCLNIGGLSQKDTDSDSHFSALVYTDVKEAEREYEKFRYRMSELGLHSRHSPGTKYVDTKSLRIEPSSHSRVYVYNGLGERLEASHLDFPVVDASEKEIKLYSPNKEVRIYKKTIDAINQAWKETLDMLEDDHTFVYEPFERFTMLK